MDMSKLPTVVRSKEVCHRKRKIRMNKTLLEVQIVCKSKQGSDHIRFLSHIL
jgi:hypothetical protein